MDRPNLTPEQQQDTDPKEQSLADIISERYPAFPLPTDAPDAPELPRFIVDKGESYTPVSLERAIEIATRYESKGSSRAVLLEMLDKWYGNAKYFRDIADENPEVRIQIEGLQQSSELRLAKYVSELGE